MLRDIPVLAVLASSSREGPCPDALLRKLLSDPREEKSMASCSRELSKADVNATDCAMSVDSGSTLKEGGGLNIFNGPSTMSGGSAEDGLEGGGVGTPMPR